LHILFKCEVEVKVVVDGIPSYAENDKMGKLVMTNERTEDNRGDCRVAALLAKTEIM
jgi:hypothetical protein